ncbi:MFS transporter [Methylobacterium pseudosasicola]|uniref:Sugar phosphate permease n=1 Tax=Methylobacterium pseudosasicola TaxID=582667 RepID=A0A1I4U2K4_9HYPH|nr:MFS transporter [Methylobacterium pseudosasicola]SFM83155.1 Sugar phosphate permease [Methylobacterium pseudosasicola]
MSVAVAAATGVEPDAQTRLLESAVAKNTRRLVPILGLAYLFNYLDRTSVGFAALQMNQAIGLTAAQFGWGAGILFFSYCLLEVPSNVLMYRFGARRWLARIMITWGLAAAATAFAVGPMSFYVIRFMLGVFEAGFFPGVIWYISIWFPARYRTRVLALFMASTPLSSLLGSPISASLLSMDGFLGLGGWQWMFLIEGLPACLLGFACLWKLADTPKDATWLDDDERAALVNELANEKHEKPKKDLWAAMKDVRVVLLTTITFAFTIGSYGIGIWLPQILKGHGLSNIAVGWVAAIPYLFATVGMVVWAQYVDRTGKKIYNLVAALILSAVGLAASTLFDAMIPALICLTLALIGTISARTVFYTIPQSFLTGAAAAGGLAFINSVGAFGGFVGPYLVGYLKDATGSYNAGMLGMAAILLVSVFIAGSLKLVIKNA